MFVVCQFALGYFKAGMLINQSQSHDLVDFLKWVRLHYSSKDCNINRKILVLMSCGFKCDCHLFDLCQALPASAIHCNIIRIIMVVMSCGSNVIATCLTFAKPFQFLNYSGHLGLHLRWEILITDLITPMDQSNSHWTAKICLICYAA